MKTSLKKMGIGLVLLAVCAVDVYAYENIQAANQELAQKYEKFADSVVYLNFKSRTLDRAILAPLDDSVCKWVGSDAFQLKRNLQSFVDTVRALGAKVLQEGRYYDYNRYNQWVDWYNGYVNGLNAHKQLYSENYEPRIDKVMDQYNEIVDKRNQVASLIQKRTDEVVGVFDQLEKDPIWNEVSYNIDAGHQALDAYTQYSQNLADAATKIAPALERFDARFVRGDTQAGEELVPPKCPLLSSIQGADLDSSTTVLTAWFGYNNDLDSVLKTWQAPCRYSPPKVSKLLSKYREAARILDECIRMEKSLDAQEDMISSSGLDQSVPMWSYLQVSTNEYAPHLDLLSAVAQHETQKLMVSMATGAMMDTEGGEQLKADRIIEMGREMLDAGEEGGSLYLKIKDELFPKAARLHEKWILEYYAKQLDEAKLQAKRLSEAEELLLELNTAGQILDAEQWADDFAKVKQDLERQIGHLTDLMVAAQSLQIDSFRDCEMSLNSLSHPPSSSKFSVLASVLATSSGETKTRIARLKVAQVLTPDDAEIYELQAQFLDEEGEYAEAGEILTTLYAQYPDRTDYLERLALNHEKRGQVDTAEDLYRQLLAAKEPLGVTDIYTWLQFAGRNGFLEEEAERMRAIFPEEKALRYSEDLTGLFAFYGLWDCARAECERVLEISPSEQQFLNLCILSCSSKRQAENALRGLAEYPDSKPLSESLISAKLAEGAVMEAEEMLSRENVASFPWNYRTAFILHAVLSGEPVLTEIYDRIAESEEDLLQAYEFLIKHEYSEAHDLLQNYTDLGSFSAPQFIFLEKAWATAGLGLYDEAQAGLRDFIEQTGYTFPITVRLELQLAFACEDKKTAAEKMLLLGRALDTEAPERKFYECLYARHFNWMWWEAGRLKRECEDSFAGDEHAMQTLWILLPTASDAFESAGAVPAGAYGVGVVLLSVVIGVCVFARLQRQSRQRDVI